MSHIVTIETQVRDPVAIDAACRRLGLRPAQQETVSMFSGSATGYAVRLPGWRYPVVCEVEAGRIHFDHFGNRWGDETHLHRFLQAYAVEKATIEARRQGYSVSEAMLADGSVRLTVQAGGSR
jgi:hypothetical protein